MISIIDCGMGNLGSIVNILKFIGSESEIITRPQEIEEAEKLILPGVGSWDNGMNKLQNSGLIEVLNSRVLNDGVPILGICLGMQLMFESSEEGKLPGIAWLPGHVRRFNFSGLTGADNRLRVPHMGWNIVKTKKDSLLANKSDEETRFYFVHSYHVNCSDSEHELMTCKYGYDFACGVNRANIWGVQFHPEKSHKFGMNLMRKFSEL